MTNITIYENDKNLNGIVNVTVNDLDKDYSNSRYSLEILSDVEEVGDQISLWPSESSALTAQVLFQLKPVTDNEDSIFDYETRDKLEFQLKVTGLNESYMDSVNFTINILVRPITLQKNKQTVQDSLCLQDVNDNPPLFSSETYHFYVKEDLSNLELDAESGQFILAKNISASDHDKSPEFGMDSLM